MDRPEPTEPEEPAGDAGPAGKGGPSSGKGEPASSKPLLQLPGYGRWVGLLAVVILILITVNTIVTKPNGATGVTPGVAVPPFAVPLATGNLSGDADIATHADQGAAGDVPACKERGPEILNICQLYEQGPVVLALFVAGGSCPDVLGDMQALVSDFPRVRFAAVAIKNGTSEVRKLIRSHGLDFPVGLDRDGALAALYKLATCPQVSFIERGGVVQSRALLRRPSLTSLRARVAALAATDGGQG